MVRRLEGLEEIRRKKLAGEGEGLPIVLDPSGKATPRVRPQPGQVEAGLQTAAQQEASATREAEEQARERELLSAVATPPAPGTLPEAPEPVLPAPGQVPAGEGITERATLINEAGDRIAVDVGSQEAQGLFGGTDPRFPDQKFTLEGGELADTRMQLTADVIREEPEAEGAPEAGALEPEVVEPRTEVQRQEETADILTRLGIQAADPDQSPITAFADVFSQVSEKLGLPGIVSQFESVQKDFDALIEKKDDAIFEVNENPWLSEGVRKRKLAGVDSRFEAREAALVNKRLLFQNLIESGREEARFIAEQGVSAGERRQDLTLKAIELADKREEAERKLVDDPAVKRFRFAQSQGYEGDFVDYISFEKELGRAPTKADIRTIGKQLIRIDAEGNPQVIFTGDPDADKKADKIKTQLVKADNVVANIEEALGLVSPFTAGFGALAAGIPTTAALTLSETLKTVQANLGFDELTAMREASPTGGALGQVSEREIDFLQATLQSLNQKLAPAELRENLEAVLTHYNNWRATLQGGDTGAQPSDEEFNILRQEFPDLTDEEIRGVLGPPGFSGVGGDTNQATGSPLTVRLPSGETHEGGSASWRNNNPLNIKYGSFAQNYNSSQGSAATDGGNFAAFSSVAEGMKAAKDLLKAPSYTSLPLEQAMRRWSGNGYGADVAPANLRGKTTGEMNNAELDRLIKAMRQREGWREGRVIA